MTQNVIAILAWLAGAFFCGALPLGGAVILFFVYRRHLQVASTVASARRTTLAALKPASGLARLQGRIAPLAIAIDGRPENALVYLRMKVEVYVSDSDGSGWRGMTDKTRAVPFILEDGTGSIWINPDGLDKQLLGDGIVPDAEQIQAACILLGISIPRFHSQLRYRLWELRSGQTLIVVGQPIKSQGELLIRKVESQPFIVSPLSAGDLDSSISGQIKKARVWMYAIGIPGAVLLLCGLSGAIVTFVRTLIAN